MLGCEGGGAESCEEGELDLLGAVAQSARRRSGQGVPAACGSVALVEDAFAAEVSAVVKWVW